MDGATFTQVLEDLLQRYPVEDWSRDRSPFEVLVAVIISQNTTVANERRALARLREGMGITPQAFVAAPLRDLEEALRPAGLFRSKARRLKGIAQRLTAADGSDLLAILDQPTAQARQALMELPGVGPKTADVVLNMVAGHPTFPVDTHIWRIATRWELTEGRTYEDVRESLEEQVPPAQRQQAHLALIRFGRETCKAIRPQCPICPVARHCPWYAKVRADEIQARLYEP